jgi:molybdopterin molybdotransferase
MMEFRAAQDAIVAACPALPRERIAYSAALGRVLAASVIAEEDLVPFARSAMDGYAVAAADLAALPVTLPIGGTIYAAAGEPTHARGTASAIATGAPLPHGADAVIPVEDVEVKNGTIRITDAVTAGSSVFPPGDDARQGDCLAAVGEVVSAAMLGILAAAGVQHVEVFRRPRVAIVCTGDELVAIDAMPAYGQIRNSNASVLLAALEALGAQVPSARTVGDDPAALRIALASAITEADLVVTTGGASVGERDLVKATCEQLGVVFAFRNVALRPAKPSAFGVCGVRRVVVLPGNPAAAFVGFQELVRPAVLALAGWKSPLLPRITALLDGTIRAKPGRTFAAFAALRATNAGFVAAPLENQCSSLTRTTAEACGFIVVPPGTRTYGHGAQIDFDVIDWSKITRES